MKEELGIDEWLELVKEDKKLKGAYISFAQYMYLLEKENQELKNSIDVLQKELNEENLQCSKYAIENQELKKDIKNIIRILNKNCDDLEATEEEFESLKKWNK